MAKKILVTGGAGFLGAPFVKSLVKKGRSVRVLDNLSRSGAQRLSGVQKEIEFIKGDIRDAAVTLRAAKGVDAVCHLAFVNGTEFFYSRPDLVLDVGVRGMVNVLDACLKHKIGDLLLVSSSEVYQTPPRIPTDETAPLSVPDVLNPRYSYGGAKIISEIMALNYGLKYFRRVTVVRPHNVYGPDMGWEHVIPQFVGRMKKLAARPGSGELRFPIQGSGRETRSFIFIDDFTSGLVRVFEKGAHREIYHVGTTEEVSVASLAVRVGECMGRRVRVVPGKLQPGSTKRRCPDIRKMIKLGFKPAWPLSKGLPQTVEWYNEHDPRKK